MRSFIVVPDDLVVVTALTDEQEIVTQLIEGTVLQGIALDAIELKIIHHLTQFFLGTVIHQNKDVILRVSQPLTNVVSTLHKGLKPNIAILLRLIVVEKLITVDVLKSLALPHRIDPPVRLGLLICAHGAHVVVDLKIFKRLRYDVLGSQTIDLPVPNEGEIVAVVVHVLNVGQLVYPSHLRPHGCAQKDLQIIHDREELRVVTQLHQGLTTPNTRMVRNGHDVRTGNVVDIGMRDHIQPRPAILHTVVSRISQAKVIAVRMSCSVLVQMGTVHVDKANLGILLEGPNRIGQTVRKNLIVVIELQHVLSTAQRNGLVLDIADIAAVLGPLIQTNTRIITHQILQKLKVLVVRRVIHHDPLPVDERL
jgi:hypothetical protein